MRASVGDVALHYEVAGDAGPALILLHGGPGADHTLFKPEFSVLADVARVVYLDQRGSGESDVGSPQTWTWPQWADDVVAFCAALDIEAPILVGVSSGGLVALTLAAPHPWPPRSRRRRVPGLPAGAGRTMAYRADHPSPAAPGVGALPKRGTPSPAGVRRGVTLPGRLRARVMGARGRRPVRGSGEPAWGTGGIAAAGGRARG